MFVDMLKKLARILQVRHYWYYIYILYIYIYILYIIYIFMLLNCSPVIPISWNHTVIKNEVDHYQVHHGDSFPMVLSPRSHVWPRQCWVWGRWCRAPVWSNYSSLRLSQVGGDWQILGIKKRGTGYPWPSRGTGAFIAQLDGNGNRLEQCDRYIRLLDDRVKRSGSTTIIRESAGPPCSLDERLARHHITSHQMTWQCIRVFVSGPLPCNYITGYWGIAPKSSAPSVLQCGSNTQHCAR